MLNIVIVGAGIAGLSAAVALRRAGHRVTIYERSALNNEVGAAINVPPNSARVLLAWGLDPVAEKLVVNRGVVMGVGATAEQLNFTPFGDWVKAKYGQPFYFAHRVDLHEALKKLATEEAGEGAPATILLKQEVVAYDPAEPSITLASGEVIKGDVVIAADGVHSIATEVVVGQPNPPQPQELYNGCFRFLIPTSELAADPESQWWTEEESHGRIQIYMNGPTGNRLVSYPCRSQEIHNFVGMFHSEELASARKEDWHAQVGKSDLLEAFSDFHPKLRAVIGHATEVKRWPLLYRPPVPTWQKGKMVICGDAAHPMLPHQGQGGAQGIEDGVALGIALCGATPETVEQRLAVFEKIRRNRASAIQVMSNAGHEQTHLIHAEIAKYSDVIPKNQIEFGHFNWGHDVTKHSIDLVKEVDPEFQLPPNFFQGNPYLPEAN